MLPSCRWRSSLNRSVLRALRCPAKCETQILAPQARVSPESLQLNSAEFNTAVADKDRPRRRRRRPPPGHRSVAELATQAECAQSTVYEAIVKGRLAASRWRGLIIIADDEAHAFLMPQPL